MKRRLNSRLLIGILLPTIALGAGISGLHSVQVRRNARALLARADRAERDGDLVQAAEYLRLFLGYEPNHSAALAKFGAILASRARTVDDRIRAVQTLEQVLRLDPNYPEIRRKLIDLAMGLGWYPVARTHLRILLDPGRSIGDSDGGRPPAQESELEFLLAVCSESVHDDRDAVLHYWKAISLGPQRLDSYVRLARLLRDRLSDADGADRVMDAREVKNGLIAANSKSFRAYLERGLYRKEFKIEGYDTDVANALQLAPQEVNVLLAAAALAVERGDVDAARRHLTNGLDHHPRDARISTALAWLERKARRFDKAEECLRRGVDAATDREGRSQLLWLLADTLIDERKWAESRAVVEQLGQEPVRPELLKYLDARIGIGESRWFDAKRQLESIYPLLGAEQDLAYQTNLLLGRCFEQFGDLDQREIAFRRAITLDPGRVEAHIGLAATREATGKLDEAIDEYRRVFDRAPVVGMALARLLILRNLHRTAGQHDWKDVEQVLQHAARSLPDSTGVTILRAETLVAQSQPGARGTCSRRLGTRTRTELSSGPPWPNWPIDMRLPRPLW